MSSLSEGIYEDGLIAGKKAGYQSGVDETERRDAIRTAEELVKRFPAISNEDVSEIARGVSAQEVAQIRKGFKLV